MPWGERVAKVNKKVFVFLGRDMDTHFGLAVKLPTSKKAALALPFTEPTGYGLGKSGWVSARLEPGAPVSFEQLRDWVIESYRAVAPKALAAQVLGPWRKLVRQESEVRAQRPWAKTAAEVSELKPRRDEAKRRETLSAGVGFCGDARRTAKASAANRRREEIAGCSPAGSACRSPDCGTALKSALL